MYITFDMPTYIVIARTPKYMHVFSLRFLIADSDPSIYLQQRRYSLPLSSLASSTN